MFLIVGGLACQDKGECAVEYAQPLWLHVVACGLLV